MSTFSTNEADRKQRVIEQSLQCAQERIILYGAWASDLADEIRNLRARRLFTIIDFLDQQALITFKEHQINEIRSILNRLELRAHMLARMLRIIP